MTMASSVEYPVEKMLRVQIESLIAGIDGAESIMTSESATIGNLVAGFVFERRLRPEIVSEFALQDPRGNVFKRHRTVGSYALKDGDKLFLVKNEPKMLLGCRNWFALAAVAFGVALVGFSVVIYLYAKSGAYPFDYVIVIDAGSSHTDLYIYQWRGVKVRGTGVVQQTATTRCEGHGIANYADSRGAAKSLGGCLDFAKSQVPSTAWEKTEIYLGATAGMRILAMTNASVATSIMGAVRTEIGGNYMFKYSPDHVKILTGVEEGVDGWISSNYLAKALLFDHITPKYSYGALDLGGASAQISFEDQVNSTDSVMLFGEQYPLYSHSFLCYGLREAERRLKAALIQAQNASVIQYPCGPLGNQTRESYKDIFGHYCTKDFTATFLTDVYVFEGTSNSSECAEEVTKLFNTTYCPYSGDQCSFDGVFQPTVRGDFMAFSGFYFIIDFLNLTSRDGFVSLPAYRSAAEEFCRKHWNQIDVLNASDPHSPFLTQYCFDAHYVDKILTEGYRFNESGFGNIRFKKDIDGTAIGWTLGLALNSTNTRDNESPEYLVSTAVFISLLVVFTVLLIFALVFFLRALKASRRYRDYEPISSYGAI